MIVASIVNAVPDDPGWAVTISPLYSGFKRSAQDLGISAPISSSTSLFPTNPRYPTYIPVQIPFGSLNLSGISLATGDIYGSTRFSSLAATKASIGPPNHTEAVILSFSALILANVSPLLILTNSVFIPVSFSIL